MLMMFVASPETPRIPVGPEALELPPCTRMPLPLGKFAMTLFAIVALVRFATVLAEPKGWMLIALPFDVAVEVGLVKLLFEMLASLIVPLKFRISTPCQAPLFIVLPVMVTVPDKLFSVPATFTLKATFDVSAPATVPLLLSVLFCSVKFVTPVPFIPLPLVLWMLI